METLIDNTPQYSSGTLKVQVTSILNARPIVDPQYESVSLVPLKMNFMKRRQIW